LERAATLGTLESRRELFWDRFEALVKSDRGSDARRVLDEAVSDGGRDTNRLRSHMVAGLNALLGRYRPPPMDSATARQIASRLRNQPLSPPQPSFSELLAARDTAGARRVLAAMDSATFSTDIVRRVGSVGPEHLASAEHHLALGDTARAEAILAQIEQPLNDSPFQFNVSLLLGSHRPWLGHAWMLSGDLFAARRRPEAAARKYRRVIGLWEGGDPDLTPVVTRARARLDSLSRR
jgi:hypothetical protein